MAGYSWEQNDDNDSFGLDVYDFYNDNLSLIHIFTENQHGIGAAETLFRRLENSLHGN